MKSKPTVTIHLKKAAHLYWPPWVMFGHFCSLGDFRSDGEGVLFRLDLVTVAWSGEGVLWSCFCSEGEHQGLALSAWPLPSSHKMVFSPVTSLGTGMYSIR